MVTSMARMRRHYIITQHTDYEKAAALSNDTLDSTLSDSFTDAKNGSGDYNYESFLASHLKVRHDGSPTGVAV